MHIIETRRAPSPRRVRIFLAEKRLNVRFEELDLMDASLQTPAFTALNPWQRVPVLVFDDGSVLCETVAICRYFETLHPEPALMGRGALGVAQTEMWQRRVEFGLLAAVAHVFRHLHPRMAHLEVPQVAAWGEANKAKVSDELAKLDARLAVSPYVAGDTFSIADITALVAIDFMKPAKLPAPATYSNVMRWYGAVSERPSYDA